MVNTDGSINVEETWNMNKLNSNVVTMNLQMKNISKENISDLKVFRSTNDSVINFVSGDYDEENIKTGNYSVIDSGDKIILLCGVGRYADITVSYKVNDVITLYGDCADLQLELLDNSLGVTVNSITGQVYYPQEVQKTGMVNAWKKSNNITSEITNKDLQKFTFEENNIAIDNSNVKIRVVMPNSFFKNAQNVQNDMMANSIITEEKNNVFTSNAKNTFINMIILFVELIVLLIMIINMFKYIKELGRLFSNKPTKKMKYSRELPFDNITPGQAAFIKDINRVKMGDIFSATLLSMKIKGVIDIVYVGDNNNLENTFLKIIDTNPVLSVEEEPVFDFLIAYLEKFQKTDLTISLNMIQKYIAHSSNVVSKLKKEMEESIKSSLSSYDSKADKRVSKRLREIIYYFIILTILVVIPGKMLSVFALTTWIGILAVINIVFCISIAFKTNIFDQEGVNHREMLKAFERYMLEFSEFRNKGVPEISIWEYYIIFAMAFGISKKVLEEINACYPNVEDSGFMEYLVACRNIEKCNFKKSFLFATSAE